MKPMLGQKGGEGGSSGDAAGGRGQGQIQQAVTYQVSRWHLPLGGSGEGACFKPHGSCLVQGGQGAEMEDGSSDIGAET